MGKKTDRNLIVGLDIGTSKVAAIVGEMSDDGKESEAGCQAKRRHVPAARTVTHFSDSFTCRQFLPELGE